MTYFDCEPPGYGRAMLDPKQNSESHTIQCARSIPLALAKLKFLRHPGTPRFTRTDAEVRQNCNLIESANFGQRCVRNTEIFGVIFVNVVRWLFASTGPRKSPITQALSRRYLQRQAFIRLSAVVPITLRRQSVSFPHTLYSPVFSSMVEPLRARI